MLRNYLKIALRNLLRQKGFAFINITGLSIGLACCMLILLYTKDEISYDAFHEKKDQLYRVTCRIQGKEGRNELYGIAAMIEGPSFKQDIPEVESYTRVQERDFILRKGRETFNEKASWADANFFSVFSFPLVSGDPKSVLKDIHSVVLTEETAQKYFGTTAAIGKSLEFEINNKFETFVVSGIAKRSPQNSSIKFDILLPFNYLVEKEYDDNWLWLSYPTYLVMHKGADVQAVSRKMTQIYNRKARNQVAEASKHGFAATFIWGVQPFLEMHLDPTVEHTPEVSNPIYSYILICIAVFVLLIACINFVNLTVSQSLRRGREIGIRKVVGGQRRQLIFQFLGESFVLTFCAFLLAVLLTEAALPFFNELANKQLSLSYLLDFQLVGSFILLFLGTGFAAGFYPALVLSGFDPMKTLYNRFQFSGKNYLSKSLVVLQFSLATFLIITTLFVYSQFHFLTTKDLGYNDKNLISLRVGQDGNMPLMTTFGEEFRKAPGVVSVAPALGGDWGTVSKANGVDIDIAFKHIDEHYFPTLGIQLKAGRNFSPDFPADSTHSVIVNEAYIKKAGWKDSGVGHTVDFLNGSEQKLTIVGVVKDYHYGSLKEEIGPMLFTADPHMPFGRFYLRVQPEKIPQALRSVEATYRKLDPFRPFQYKFEEDINRRNYETEAKWKQIISFAAVLTIFISCIGLFGLVSLSIQRRTKEIGIRKVLGASVWQVSTLLSRNFLYLVLIAFVVAIPAAWYATQRWLENFAYRIDIDWKVFAASALLTTAIAIVTVGFNTFRTALMNPANSLKTE